MTAVHSPYVEPPTIPEGETVAEYRRNRRAEVRVTKLEHVDGYWRAHVSSRGTTLEVDRRYGSWRATAQLAPRVERWPLAREVLPRVAAELQRRLPASERRPKLQAKPKEVNE